MVLKVKNIYSVLIVDDDSGIVELIEASLLDLSVNVSTASSGLDALEFLKDHKVDCIITDISMPKMTGPEFISELQARKDFTPFFFITGYLDYPREQLNIFKPIAVIFKPFDFEEMAMLVKNYLTKNS